MQSLGVPVSVKSLWAFQQIDRISSKKIDLDFWSNDGHRRRSRSRFDVLRGAGNKFCRGEVLNVSSQETIFFCFAKDFADDHLAETQKYLAATTQFSPRAPNWGDSSW